MCALTKEQEVLRKRLYVITNDAYRYIAISATLINTV